MFKVGNPCIRRQSIGVTPFARRQLTRETPPASNRGFILLVVLSLTVILAAAVEVLAWKASTRSLCADAGVAHQQSMLAGLGAVDILCHALHQTELVSKVRDNGRVQGTMVLGNITVHYVAWDEASKIRIRPESKKDSLPAELVAMGIRFREDSPLKDVCSKALTFEEVFAVGIEELDTFYGFLPERKAAMETITLWGDGRLNINTASEEAFKEALSGLIPETASMILAHRKQRHIDDLSTWAHSLGLQDRVLQAVLSRFKTDVDCVSVRLIIQGTTLRSDAFAVLRIGNEETEVLLWKELPPMGQLPAEEKRISENRHGEAFGRTICFCRTAFERGAAA